MKDLNEQKRAKALKAVSSMGHNLKNYPEYSDDKEIAIAAVSHEALAHGDDYAFCYVSERLQHDSDVVIAALNSTPYVAEVIDEDVLNRPEVKSFIEQKQHEAQNGKVTKDNKNSSKR